MATIKIPLFPLNTVLYPGIPLSLHIFEERYKQMVNDCIKDKQPFGVVLIREGTEAFGPLATPHRVGCTATITQVLPLMQGRMNLIAVGDERFRVVEFDRTSAPYLTAEVEMIPLEDSAPRTSAAHATHLREDLMRYVEILAQIRDTQIDPANIPTEPIKLGYVAAYLLSLEHIVGPIISGNEKQHLLEAEDVSAFLAGTRRLYQRELILLDSMALQRQRETDGDDLTPFSMS